MARLDPIVAVINEALRTTVFKDKRFLKPAMFGIAEPTPNKVGETYESLPGIIRDDGEITMVYPDDKNIIQVYHKVNSLTESADRSQYGNGNSNMIRTASMSMIIFGNRKVIKRRKDDLELFISASIPSKLSKADLIVMGLKDCSITHTSSDFNSLFIYTREYNTKKYYLKPSHLFFEMKYTIECKFNKACINTCEC